MAVFGVEDIEGEITDSDKLMQVHGRRPKVEISRDIGILLFINK